MPGYASKQDMLELATLRYILLFFRVFVQDLSQLVILYHAHSKMYFLFLLGIFSEMHFLNLQRKKYYHERFSWGFTLCPPQAPPQIFQMDQSMHFFWRNCSRDRNMCRSKVICFLLCFKPILCFQYRECRSHFFYYGKSLKAGVCCGPCNPSKWKAELWWWLEV